MLSPRMGQFVLLSYLILLLIPLLFPIKNIKLIVFIVFILENLVVVTLYLKGKYFS